MVIKRQCGNCGNWTIPPSCQDHGQNFMLWELNFNPVNCPLCAGLYISGYTNSLSQQLGHLHVLFFSDKAVLLQVEGRILDLVNDM